MLPSKGFQTFFRGLELGEPAAFLFDLLSRMEIGGNAMVRLSFWAILLGLLAALFQAPLPSHAELRQDQMTRVAADFLIGKICVCHSDFGFMIYDLRLGHANRKS